MKLDPNEIDLWFADSSHFSLNDLRVLSLGWMSAKERERFDRYQFSKHKHEFLLGRYLLRSVLSLYSDVSPQNWVFEYNDYGKPSIAASLQDEMTLPLYFNLSHSRGKLVLAVARYKSIGVDIEYGLKARRIEKIAGRYFSPIEVQEINSLPQQHRLMRFYDLWSLKEAYIKACGLGLAIPLSDFSYRFTGSDTVSIEFAEGREDSPEPWQFWQLGTVPDFHIGLAVKSAAAEHLEIAKLFQLKPLGGLITKPLIVEKASHWF